jgi:hypothetical protein
LRVAIDPKADPFAECVDFYRNAIGDRSVAAIAEPAAPKGADGASPARIIFDEKRSAITALTVAVGECGGEMRGRLQCGVNRAVELSYAGELEA